MQEAQEIELMPCPFCGGEATISDCINWGKHVPYIECLQCAASSSMAATLEEVIAFWNNRWMPDDVYTIRIPKEIVAEWNEPLDE